MSERTAAERALLEDFAAHAGDLPGADVAWLRERRARAHERFRAGGLPHRRIEAWKYTDLRAALDEGYAPCAPFIGPVERLTALRDPFAGIDGARLVLVNGYYNAALSTPDGLPPGVEIADLSHVDGATPDWVRDHLGEGDSAPVAASSLALMRGGVAIRLPKGVAVTSVLHMRFLNPDRGRAAQHCRVLLVLEGQNGLTLLESHVGEAGAQGFSNIGFDVHAGDGTWLKHTRLQSEGNGAVHVTSLGASVGAKSTYHLSQIDLGGRLSRLDLDVALDGEEATLDLGGLAVLGGKAHADLTTRIDHRVTDGLSRQSVRQVLGGHARGVYQGLVRVSEGAVRTDSHQLAKAMLVSRHAEADLKPELEIFADDVKCGHGATIGDIEPDTLFYLRARGIPEGEARAMLIRGFIEDAVGSVLLEDVQEAIWREVDAVLPSVLEAA